MAVLIEAISVIVRTKAIKEKMRGGIAHFDALIPNATGCRDDHLVRVGFMSPADSRHFLDSLTSRGLVFFDGQQFVDVAVVDQHHGPTAPTPWLTIIHTPEGFKFAALSSEELGDFMVPVDWSPEMSMTRRGTFIDTADLDTILKPLGSDNGIHAFYDRRLNKVMYLGSPEQHEAGSSPLTEPVPSYIARQALLGYLREQKTLYPSLEHLRLAIKRGEIHPKVLSKEVRWGLHYAGVPGVL
ncbi:hypothetical protein [Deinococcus seoulensis]|nr:hypothetical protein [Deinococcus seoulensis]